MKKDNSSQRKTYPLRWAILAGALVIALAAGILFITTSRQQPAEPEGISLSAVASGIVQGKITKIEDTLTSGEFVVTFTDGTQVEGRRDPSTSLLEQLNLLGATEEELSTIEFTISKPLSTATAANPIALLLSMGLIAGIVVAAVRSNTAERSNRKRFKEVEIPEIGFDDVAGLEDNLQELRDIVTFLKDGQKFSEIGAKMPRGVLMVGDPGTGKTLIARAVAGEAGVPFFATSGSEFTEVFVGVGASRIRSLFAKARKRAPCIVFIDEIDAVGRSRHRSESGAEAEQDQTLNQLLVEMDGFDGSDGVVVLAATNRIDVLDSALLRPGRFDRRVYINRPDIKGREAILAIHTDGKRLAPQVSLANIAKATPGLVGADLANIVNEAAISAVRRGDGEIQMCDFEDAIEKHIAGGVARKNQVMSQSEREIVAYHEAGHAVVMHVTEHSDPVYKITIIPRGPAGGYTMALPESDSMLISRRKILARITGLLGGRAAEELFFGDITNGASNDLNVATQLAEEMVMRLGMDSRTGLRVYNAQGRSIFSTLQGSQKTFESIDGAVNSILEDCYNQARSILQQNQACVQHIAEELLEFETIDQARFVELVKITT